MAGSRLKADAELSKDSADALLSAKGRRKLRRVKGHLTRSKVAALTTEEDIAPRAQAHLTRLRQEAKASIAGGTSARYSGGANAGKEQKKTGSKRKSSTPQDSEEEGEEEGAAEESESGWGFTEADAVGSSKVQKLLGGGNAGFSAAKAQSQSKSAAQKDSAKKAEEQEEEEEEDLDLHEYGTHSAPLRELNALTGLKPAARAELIKKWDADSLLFAAAALAKGGLQWHELPRLVKLAIGDLSNFLDQEYSSQDPKKYYLFVIQVARHKLKGDADIAYNPVERLFGRAWDLLTESTTQ